MKIETVYSWNAINELIAGRSVMALDKLENSVFDLKRCKFSLVADIIKLAENDNNRVYFYMVYEDEGEEQNV